VFYSIYRLSSTKDGSEDVPKSSPKLPHIIHGFFAPPKSTGWLGSRVVSMLDSGAEGPRFKSVATLSGNSVRQTVHTRCASVHQAAKLVAALLWVAGGNCRPGGK